MMMRGMVPLLPLLLFLCGVETVLAQAPRTLTLASPILQEDRRILVRLPRNYDQDTAARYPVLYKLDGDNDLERYHNAIDVLSAAGAMPDLIVVAIPDGRGKRERDLTPPVLHQDEQTGQGEMGHGDRFLDFIEKELIPNIDATYRTNPGQRILAGHSRGALLALYSLIAKPQLFQARFVFSAPLMRDDQRLIQDTQAFLKKNRGSVRSFLYCAWGGDENENMKRSQVAMRAMLAKDAPKGLRWFADTAAGANHQQSQFRALPSALFEYFGAAAKGPSRR